MISAKKYISELTAIHGNDYKKLRIAILNRVNSEYINTSNNHIDVIWRELNKKFPS